MCTCNDTVHEASDSSIIWADKAYDSTPSSLPKADDFIFSQNGKQYGHWGSGYFMVMLVLLAMCMQNACQKRLRTTSLIDTRSASQLDRRKGNSRRLRLKTQPFYVGEGLSKGTAIHLAIYNNSRFRAARAMHAHRPYIYYIFTHIVWPCLIMFLYSWISCWSDLFKWDVLVNAHWDGYPLGMRYVYMYT